MLWPLFIDKPNFHQKEEGTLSKVFLFSTKKDPRVLALYIWGLVFECDAFWLSHIILIETSSVFVLYVKSPHAVKLYDRLYKGNFKRRSNR